VAAPALSRARLPGLVIGVVALLIPLIPGVVFLMLATVCFSRSSPAMERWPTHPRFGKLIINWRSSGVIPRGMKWIITFSMTASYSLIFLETESRVLQALAAATMLAAIVYVWKRPEQPTSP
jgi:uncharacterized membrane protein YbaN (DUF454 family)